MAVPDVGGCHDISAAPDVGGCDDISRVSDVGGWDDTAFSDLVVMDATVEQMTFEPTVYNILTTHKNYYPSPFSR